MTPVWWGEGMGSRAMQQGCAIRCAAYHWAGVVRHGSRPPEQHTAARAKGKQQAGCSEDPYCIGGGSGQQGQITCMRSLGRGARLAGGVVTGERTAASPRWPPYSLSGSSTTCGWTPEQEEQRLQGAQPVIKTSCTQVDPPHLQCHPDSSNPAAHPPCMWCWGRWRTLTASTARQSSHPLRCIWQTASSRLLGRWRRRPRCRRTWCWLAQRELCRVLPARHAMRRAARRACSQG